MENTSNYGLKRWDPKDRILHTEFNDNWDKIDTALKASADGATEALAALKNCGNCGIYYETYTGNGKLTMTRTFPGKPLIIFISPEDGGDHAQRFIRGCATAMCLCGSDQFSPKLTWTGPSRQRWQTTTAPIIIWLLCWISPQSKKIPPDFRPGEFYSASAEALIRSYRANRPEAEARTLPSLSKKVNSTLASSAFF